MVVADKRLWLSADRETVIADGDPRAAFLLCSPGDEVTDEDAKRYGIKAAAKPADKQSAPPSNKGGAVEVKRS